MSSIDHPQHYGGSENPYETIKVLEAWMTRDEMIGFCKGNALKYLSRHREKGGLSDLEKSAWYGRYLVEDLKAEADKPNKERLNELMKLKPVWAEPEELLTAEDLTVVHGLDTDAAEIHRKAC